MFTQLSLRASVRRTHGQPASPRRTVRAVTAAALAASTLLSASAWTVATSPAASAAESDTLSGLYTGAANITDVRAFEAWRGAPVGVVTDFVDSRTWDTLSKPTWAADRWKNTNYLVAWGVAMIPQSGGSLQEGAAGRYNGYFKTLAETLTTRGLGDSVIRLGWEMNGDWFPWSAVKDPDAFNAYWRQIVNTMRSVPGAQFKFEWAPVIGQGAAGFDKTWAYPGDAYVDLIGNSAYDQSWAETPDQDAKRWTSMVNMAGGLQWSVDFAKAHGKRNSMSEWALSDRCDGRGGGDNTYYIEQMARWFDTNDYYYESMFDHRTSSCEQHSITDGPFPNARAAYKNAFGPAPVVTAAPAPVTAAPAAPAPAPAPVTAPAPVPTAGAIQSVSSSLVKVSWSSTRSNAQSLDWKGISSKVYIFAAPDFTATRVSFYLDDPKMTRTPMSVEGSAPWDLKGGTASQASAFDAAPLSRGKHTLTVLFDTPTGKKVSQVTFLR